MREIKFHGKRVDNGEWVYGDLCHNMNGGISIMPKCFFGSHIFDDDETQSNPTKDGLSLGGWFSVMPETVGQFTGFKSLDKKKSLHEDVYEGDIFRQIDETDEGDEITYHVVMWLNERGAFYMIPVDHYAVIRDNGIPKEKEFNWLLDDACLYDFSFDVKLTKVGNINENPELLS